MYLKQYAEQLITIKFLATIASPNLAGKGTCELCISLSPRVCVCMCVGARLAIATRCGKSISLSVSSRKSVYVCVCISSQDWLLRPVLPPFFRKFIQYPGTEQLLLFLNSCMMPHCNRGAMCWGGLGYCCYCQRSVGHASRQVTTLQHMTNFSY